jgi:hypothetical protein
MVREWVAGAWLLLMLGCGARTELLADSESDDVSGGGSNAGGSPTGMSTGGGMNAAGMNAAGMNVGGMNVGGMNVGGMNVGGAPLAMRCELEGNDARVAGIKPDELATLDGAQFVTGNVKSYHWALQKEDCDAVVPDAEFTLEGENERVVKFQPSRPAFYHFTLQATDFAGNMASCKLEVPVEGVGMRVELCWDTSTTTDLDLYLHNPSDQAAWFAPGADGIDEGLNNTTCNTSNGVAELRNGHARVDWGYADSPLSACNTPSFDGFVPSGRCPNPRAADDNNQEIATGTTERMQLDNPRSGETFRVMVQNFSNAPARPHIFVYCGGEKAASFDAPPTPSNFVSPNPGTFGVMWRAADVTTFIDETGKTWCKAVRLASGGVTNDDTSF